MADIEEALKTYLLAQTGLTALIDRRLHPEETPQGVDLATQTAVVWITVDDIKDHTLTGQSELESPNIQFTAYAPTKPQAKAIAEQLKTALCDYHGTLSGVVVQYIKLVNELPGLDKTPDGTVKVHTIDLEFEVNFEK